MASMSRQHSTSRQQYQDFLYGFAPPRRQSLIAAIQAGMSGLYAENSNPQEPIDEQADALDDLANFLFVRKTPTAVQSAVVAHGVNVVHGALHEMTNVVLPYLNHAVGGTILTFANIKAIGSTMTFLGGLNMGTWADKFGPKYTLMLSHLGAAVSYGAYCASSSPKEMYMASLPLFLSHSFQLTSTAVTMNSDENMRARALGRVGGLYGLGFFAGSIVLVGAIHFVKKRYYIMGLAAGAQVVLFSIVALAYPKTEDAVIDQPDLGTQSSLSTVIMRPGVLRVLAFKMIVVVSSGSITFLVQQFAMSPFHFSVQGTAMLMSYIGGLQIVSQSLVTDMASPLQIYLYTLSSVGVSLLGMGLSPAIWPCYMFWLAPLTVAFHCANTTIGSLLTLYVPEEELGTVLGLGIATMPIGNLLAVSVAARLEHYFGFRVVPLSACAFLLCTSGVLFASGYGPPELPDEELGES